MKQELLEEEWNETPYFQVFNYYSVVDDIDDNTVEADVKLEEKFRIPVPINTQSKEKPSYRHLIRLYCKRCQRNSQQDFQNYFRKSFVCEKRRCKEPLSFQCVTCDSCYKHLNSAYRHVRHNCKGLKSIIKTEIKTELDTQTANTKVYNPYRRKRNPSIVATKKKRGYLECAKCSNVYKTPDSLRAHEKICGIKPNIKCEFCSFKSKYLWNVKHHVENIHIKKEKECQLRCHAPSRKTKNVNRVRKRKRVKRLVKKTNWLYCEHCNHRVYRKDHLVIHMQRCHSEIYPLNLFTCKLCKKKCGDVYSYNSHMKNKCVCRNIRVVLNDIKI